MAEEGLRARAPRAARYSSYAGEEGRAAAPNLLLVDAGRDLHDFSAAAPGEVLVTDITEFRLPDDRRKIDHFGVEVAFIPENWKTRIETVLLNDSWNPDRMPWQ